MVEVDETILIRITRTSASSIRYDSNEATITIRDNDGKRFQLCSCDSRLLNVVVFQMRLSV